MEKIQVKHLTKDYGRHKGVFDVSFTVKEGEIFGFLGPNGAGKTTTIRNLMGFIRPDSGSVSIAGKKCFENREDIQKCLGYLPGEIALMDEMSGVEFLHFIGNMKGIKDRSRMKELMDYFELDAKGKIRKMSKGMKQKIGIIAAFMQNPDILLLDEPTSGLDPLMQNKFIDLLLEEKKKGTTVLLSSHIFEEVERTCDRAAFIRNGKIVSMEDMTHIRKNKKRIFEVSFAEEAEQNTYLRLHPDFTLEKEKVTASVSGDVDGFIKELSRYTIADVKMRTLSLEEIFLHYYQEDN